MKSLLPFLFALGTALCWGLYGPTLGKARLADVTASPFKPYVGIGIAYVVIAMLGGMLAMLALGRDTFTFTDRVTRWGVAAGSLGALGALSLTLAMFTGGARIPHAVMPFVFGGAVTVTAVYSIYGSGHTLKGGLWLWVGVIGMGLSAVIVAANTPHPHPSKPAARSATTATGPTKAEG